MKRSFYLLLISVVALASCGDGGFKKSGGGLEYKIISEGKGKLISYGNFVQLHFTQVHKGKKDSVLGDSRDFIPRINLFDSVNTPAEYYKILKQVRIGDSVVLRTRADSFYKNMPDKMPGSIKKSDFIYTSLKILNFFETRTQADSANNAERTAGLPRLFKKQLELFATEVVTKNKALIAEDGKTIEAWLAKNNIKAVKTDWGIYIATSTPGSGRPVEGADIVSVNYTGRTLDSGKVFDSNVDPKGAPLQVRMLELGTIIAGWTDALLHMTKGQKATIYVPSPLGYGKDGRAPLIKPNDILIFDMEIVDVQNEQEIMAMQEEMQKKSLDSLRKVQEKK